VACLDRGTGSTRSARRPEGSRTNGVEAVQGRGRLRSGPAAWCEVLTASSYVEVTGSRAARHSFATTRGCLHEAAGGPSWWVRGAIHLPDRPVRVVMPLLGPHDDSGCQAVGSSGLLAGVSRQRACPSRRT
jgi:hypothetical protein